MLDLSSLKSVKCKFGVPAGTHLNIKGGSGKIDFTEPKFDVTASLDTGKVGFKPDSKTAYKYDMSITTGKIDDFQSSKDAGAHNIKIHVNVGKIENQD